MLDPILERFCALFGGNADTVQQVFAPGRINLMGEHLDYNGGPVLPMALDRGIRFWFRARTDRQVLLHSDGQADPLPISLDAVPGPGVMAGWGNAAAGMIALTREIGWDGPGFEALLISDLPVGSGLSSSAALLVGMGFVLADLTGQARDARAIALRAQAVEARYLGVHCGIMDSFVIAHASPGQAMHLDCGSLDWHDVEASLANHAWVVMDSRAARTLAGSAYNDRRRVCEAAAVNLGLAYLASMTDEAQWAQLDDPAEQALARHVFTETRRVAAMEQALLAQDADAVGACLQASHTSLRDDYRVSSPALDALVEHASGHPACRGARMTGAGFGGCAIALVSRSALPSFLNHMEAIFPSKRSLLPHCFPALVADVL